MKFIIGALVVVALICAFCVLFSISVGVLTPHLVAIALICLAVAVGMVVFG